MRKGIIAVLMTVISGAYAGGGTISPSAYPYDYMGGFYVQYDPKTSAIIKDIRGSLWAGYFSEGYFFMQGDMPSDDTVWEAWVSARDSFIRNSTRGVVRSDIHLTQVDCKTKKSRILQQTGFNGYWGEGDVVDDWNRPQPWSYALPGSNAETMLMITCQRAINERNKRKAKRK